MREKPSPPDCHLPPESRPKHPSSLLPAPPPSLEDGPSRVALTFQGLTGRYLTFPATAMATQPHPSTPHPLRPEPPLTPLLPPQRPYSATQGPSSQPAPQYGDVFLRRSPEFGKTKATPAEGSVFCLLLNFSSRWARWSLVPQVRGGRPDYMMWP